MTALLSMTGFGSAECPIEGGQILVRARAVNHRYADARVRISPELSEFAHHVSEAAKKRVVRGRVEVAVELTEEASAAPVLDQEKAASVLTQLGELRDKTAPQEPLPFGLLAAVPGLFRSAQTKDQVQLKAALQRALDEALAQLSQMRIAEGLSLKTDLSQRVQDCRSLTQTVLESTFAQPAAQQDRLRKRLAKLLEPSAVDEQRLEQEIALLADRADVAEEITRLKSHFDQFDELIDQGGAVGRRLDFLVQEMNREVNTIGSKTTSSEVSHQVVQLKSEIERIREQVQNLV